MGFGRGVRISFTVPDWIFTDFGVASALGVGLVGIFNIGYLGVLIGEDFPVTPGNLDFD